MQYETPNALLGKLKGWLVQSASSQERLALTGDHKYIPHCQELSMQCKRYPFIHPTSQEAPNVTDYDKVDVPLDVYSQTLAYTNNTPAPADFHPKPTIDALGAYIGQLREMIRWGTLRTCTNRWYAGSCTRCLIDEKITPKLLAAVADNLKRNGAIKISRILSRSASFELQLITASYLAFAHPNQAYDISRLPGFVSQDIFPRQIGYCGEFIFFESSVLTPHIGQGYHATRTGLEAANNGRVNVYPLLVNGAEAWASPVLRDMETFDLNDFPCYRLDDPGSIVLSGCLTVRFWDAVKIQSDLWMAVVEAGVSEKN